MKLLIFSFNNSRQFFVFFDIALLQKSIDVSMYNVISAGFLI